MAIKEVLDSLKEMAQERVKNPLWGGFIFFWLALNWDIVLLLGFGSDADVLSLIEKIKTTEGIDYDHLWYPFGYGLAYAVLSPYLNWAIQIIRVYGVKGAKINKFRHEENILDGKLKLVNKQAEIDEVKNRVSQKLEEIEKTNKTLNEKDQILQKREEECNRIKQTQDQLLTTIKTHEGTIGMREDTIKGLRTKEKENFEILKKSTENEAALIEKLSILQKKEAEWIHKEKESKSEEKLKVLNKKQSNSTKVTFSIKDLAVILENHKKWIESKGDFGERADLSGADLSEAKLRRAKLEGAKFDEKGKELLKKYGLIP